MNNTHNTCKTFLSVETFYILAEQNTTTKTSPEVETKRTTTLTTSTISFSRTSKIVPRQNVPNQTNTGLFITFTRLVLSNVGLNQTTETTTFYMENRKTAAENAEKVNGKENSNPVGNFTNSVMISVGCVVILLLIVIIVVQIRSKQKKRKQNNRDIVSFVRERSSTYCEIDDRMVPSTSEYHRISDNRDYELIRDAERERTKYSTLPTAQRSEDRNSYLTPNCKTTDFTKEMTSDDTGAGFKHQPSIDVDSHYTALPTKKKASIDCGNNSTLTSNATKSSASKEKRLLEDTEPAKIDTESPVLLRNVKGSRIDKASTLSPPSEEVTRSYIDMNKGIMLAEYESMENRSHDVHSHISEIERNPLNPLD